MYRGGLPEWLVSSMCECVERGCDTGLKCCLNASSLSPRTRRAPSSPTYTFQNELHHLTPSHTYVSDRGGVSEWLMLSICYCVGRGEPLPKIVVSMSSRCYLVLVSLLRAPCVARSLVSFIHPSIQSFIYAIIHAKRRRYLLSTQHVVLHSICICGQCLVCRKYIGSRLVSYVQLVHVVFLVCFVFSPCRFGIPGRRRSFKAPRIPSRHSCKSVQTASWYTARRPLQTVAAVSPTG